MTSSKSSIVVMEGPPAEVAPGAVLVHARAGNDSHLRLAVLLAELAAPEGADRSRALSPRSNWQIRRDSLLECLQSQQARRVVLVDPDAAWAPSPRGDAVFDDATCSRERSSFFDELIRIGGKWGWTFVRTAPRPQVSEALAKLDLPSRTKASAGEHSRAIAGLAPALQPVARWLRDVKRVAQADLVRLLDAAENEADRADALLALYEDLIGPSARDALRRLSLLREEHPINGAAGPFAPDAEEHLRVAPADHALLKESGALGLRSQAQSHGDLFAIPAPIRDRMARRLEAVDPDRARQVRAAIAKRISRVTPSDKIEAHRQAILGADLDLARQTATYYGSDLRDIGRRISQDAERQGVAAMYQQAAQVFESIVRAYDQDDAYAWHYMAFNSERSGRWRTTTSDVEPIRAAYRTSCRLADERGFYNPLYHGRRLAFDLSCGISKGRVARDLDRQLEQTRTLHGDEHVRWLVWPFKGHRQFWRELIANNPWMSRLRRQSVGRAFTPEV